MKKEIKEIIESSRKIIKSNRENGFDRIILLGDDIDKLLDYITNLQEENERLKSLYTNDKNHKIDYDYVKILYKKKNKDSVIDGLVYKSEQCRVLYDSAEKKSIENYNLQQRIDKGIDYIDNHLRIESHYGIQHPDFEGTPSYDFSCWELLDILRGDE